MSEEGAVWKDKEVSWTVLHEMARQKGCKIEEGYMVQDHVHMLIKIPLKFSVAEIVGYIKGKSAIAVARQCGGKEERS